MKKIISALFCAVLSVSMSVTAFAGAPDIFEKPEGIINTGGDFMTIAIIAGCVAAAALVIGAISIFGGKKKKK